MTSGGAEDTIARLQHALADKLLTGDLAYVGQTVLDHLTKPTQVTALGRRGAGKTSLMNMIIGARDMPDLPDVPLVELTYSDVPRYTIETTTSEIETRDGLANPEALPKNTLRVIQELPRTLLRSRTFAEINLPRTAADLRHVLDWLTETADITFWCTQDFNDLEASIWARVPQVLKDNSFLVLTKADQLKMKGALAAQTARFETTCADDFLNLYTVATKQAFAARQTGSVTNPELWASSGGEALLKGLTQQIASGQAGDLDYAAMLLAQIKDRATGGRNAHVEPSSNRATPAHRNERPAAAMVHPDLSPMQRGEALETALRILQTCAEDMSASQSAAQVPATETILTHSVQASQALATLLMDVEAGDTDLISLRNEVLESEQLIMLLQLEGTESAATDAVTALLQLKKDIAEVAFA